METIKCECGKIFIMKDAYYLKRHINSIFHQEFLNPQLKEKREQEVKERKKEKDKERMRQIRGYYNKMDKKPHHCNSCGQTCYTSQCYNCIDSEDENF